MFAFFSTVAEDQVTKIIKDSPTKSCSLDPWPTFLEYLDMLINPITSIINASLEQGKCPNFCFKEFRCSLHADFIVLVDFLHVLRSIEGRFISGPNTFKQMLGLFCRIYRFVNPSWDALRLGMFGMWWCMFVDKGRQSCVILFIESAVFLGWIIK